MIANYTQTTTANSIITSCQGDYQKLIGVGNNMWIDWVDRVHQDLNRVSRWEWLKNVRKQFYCTIGQSTYYLKGGTMPGASTITFVAINNNVATITANNTYVIGDGQNVIITGLTHTQLNGTWLLLSATPTQFTFATTGLTNLSTVADTGTANTNINTNLNCTDLDHMIDGSVINRSLINTQNFTISGTSISISYGRLYLTDIPPYDPAGAWTVPGPPVMYLVDNTGVISLYPPPDQGYVIEFQYDAVRKTIVNGSDILQVPDYYRNVMVAGVNELAAAYLCSQPGMGHFQSAVQYWNASYADGKRSMIRDKQNFPRTQFIAPVLP